MQGMVSSMFMMRRRGTFARAFRWATNPIPIIFGMTRLQKRVFVGIVGGLAMIDAATEAHVGDLKGSGGHTESFQLEKNGSRVFANVPADNSVVNVIDRKTGTLAKWDLNGAKANYPMILDE